MSSSRSPIKSPRDERRSAPRRQPAYGTVCHLTARPEAASLVGLVWNLSLTGVSMLLHERIDPGTRMVGRLQGATGARASTRELCIVHLLPLVTGDYMLGAQFTEPLAAEELAGYVV